MTTIDWVRHGQTITNAKRLIQGQLDTDVTRLTSTGTAQVQALLAGGLDVAHYDRLIVSPLQRARQTAALITAATKGHRPLTIEPRVIEGDYGDWAGRSIADLQRAHPDAVDPLTHEVTPTWLPRIGGESYAQIQDRLGQLLAELVVDHPSEHVLVISHGLTIKVAALLMLGLPASTALPEPPNASLTKTAIDPATGRRYLLGYGILPGGPE